MKHLLIILTLVNSLNYGFAQSTEVAHINTQELIAAMPEMKEAKKAFDDFQKSLGEDIKARVTSYRSKLKQYSEEAWNKSDKVNKDRQKELAVLETGIQEAQVAAEKSAEKKYIDLTEPIQKKALAAIQKTGTRLGYKYILDSSEGSSVLLANGTDIMAEVKKELGM